MGKRGSGVGNGKVETCGSITSDLGGIGGGANGGTAVGGVAALPALNTRRCFRTSNSAGVRAPASSISLSCRSVSRGEEGLSMAKIRLAPALVFAVEGRKPVAAALQAEAVLLQHLGILE